MKRKGANRRVKMSTELEMFEQCLATLGMLRSGLTIQQVRRFGVPNRFHRPMQMSLLVPDLHGPWHHLLLFLFLFRIPASSFSISRDAFGSSGLLFLVARPGATSSIQPSSNNLRQAYLPGTNLGNRCWHTHYAAIGALYPLRETIFCATALYT